MCPILAGTEQLDPNSGTRARLMKGIWNFALSLAYTKSQCISMVVPPPMAAPCTAATTGLSKSISAFISRACGESPGPGGLFRKSCTSLPAQKESPAPCQSTTRMRSSLAASLKMPARASYMREVIAFLLVGRFSSTRRMFPDRSVMISSIVQLLLRPDESELRLDAAHSPGEIGRSVIACSVVAPKAQGVTHFFLFGPQIRRRVRIRHSFTAQLDDQLDSVLRQSHGFARIVREQANPFDAEI